MEWAKLCTASARHNLASSGVRDPLPSDLGLSVEDLVLNGPAGYGPPELVERIAALHGLSEDRVFVTCGCSMALYLSFAALLEPGDEVIVERPAYECLHRIPALFGVTVRRLDRSFEDVFQPDPDRLRALAGPRTRLAVLTDLHNPSGVRIEADRLRAIVALAERTGFDLLVDEVYLDLAFGPRPSTSARLSDRVIAVSSLTKAYGLGGLRVGWILARPGVVRRASRFHDYLAVNASWPALRIATRAFDRLDSLRARALSAAASGHAQAMTFLESRADLRFHPPAGGLVVFPRLADGGDGGAVCERLRRPPFSTVIVPGSFFEEPSALRLGFGGERSSLAAGLMELGAALDERRP
jgi:aspartate/methionine/tyrosine aminotransferase